MINQGVSLDQDDKNVFSVAQHKRSEPLRECVRDALNNYFGRLNGHEVSGLYQMVMSEVEGPLLQTVLEHTGGNQSQAPRICALNT